MVRRSVINQSTQMAAAAPEKTPFRLLLACYVTDRKPEEYTAVVGPSLEFRSGQRAYESWFKSLEEAIKQFEDNRAVHKSLVEVYGDAPYPVVCKAGQIFDRNDAAAWNRYGNCITDTVAYVRFLANIP